MKKKRIIGEFKNIHILKKGAAKGQPPPHHPSRAQPINVGFDVFPHLVWAPLHVEFKKTVMDMMGYAAPGLGITYGHFSLRARPHIDPHIPLKNRLRPSRKNSVRVANYLK